jgi:hypothetical protein
MNMNVNINDPMHTPQTLPPEHRIEITPTLFALLEQTQVDKLEESVRRGLLTKHSLVLMEEKMRNEKLSFADAFAFALNAKRSEQTQ